MDRNWVIALALAAGFVVVAERMFMGGASADLLALWMAGQMLAAGEIGLVYASDPDLFRMLPPDAWADPVAETGFQGRYFPYLYPPLWAALVGDAGPWPAFEAAAGWVNAALLAATALLAARAAQAAMPVWAFVGLALVAISASTVGLLAMFENQPQIFVTFLLVLMIERYGAGSARIAGAALAVAAAVKLYPALFLLPFLIKRDWRFVGAFAVVGLALAGASVALAGWPPHQAFLGQIAAISRTVLVTGQSINLDTVLALVAHRTELTQISAAHMPPLGEEGPGWRVMARPGLWREFGLVVLVALGIATARGALTASRLVALITASTIFSPMAWGYYYLPLIFFLPMIVDRKGWITGGALAALILAPTVLALQPLLPQNLEVRIGITLFGFGVGAFVLAALHSPRTRI